MRCVRWQGIFRPDEARATSISHRGSVRSEQRSLGKKDLPPRGFAAEFGLWLSLPSVTAPPLGMLPPRASPQAKLGATKVIAFMLMTTKPIYERN